MSVIQNLVNTNLPLTGNRLGSRRNQLRRQQISNATMNKMISVYYIVVLLLSWSGSEKQNKINNISTLEY